MFIPGWLVIIALIIAWCVYSKKKNKKRLAKAQAVLQEGYEKEINDIRRYSAAFPEAYKGRDYAMGEFMGHIMFKGNMWFSLIIPHSREYLDDPTKNTRFVITNENTGEEEVERKFHSLREGRHFTIWFSGTGLQTEHPTKLEYDFEDSDVVPHNVYLTYPDGEKVELNSSIDCAWYYWRMLHEQDPEYWDEPELDYTQNHLLSLMPIKANAAVLFEKAGIN